MKSWSGQCLIRIVLTLFLLVSGGVAAQQCLALDETTCDLFVNGAASKNWQPVRISPLGVSILYFHDDDELWQLSPAIANLKSSGVTTLRFPGGELADNYDWEQHALERPNDWPREAAKDADNSARTDYLEFLGYAKALGVENLFFVVNVDGAFRASGDREDNLKRYAAKAARWVKAVKKAGFNVRYWEIGNEPYLRTGYPLTASEYARALRVFSREMRAVDPTIFIGAAGPVGFQHVAFADRLTPAQLKKHGRRDRTTRNVCRNLTVAQCIERLQKETPGRAKGNAWWATLVEQAKDSFDFAVIHRYASTDLTLVAKRGGSFWFTQAPRRLRTYLEQAKGRPVPIALTEWNSPNEKRHKSLTEIEHLLDIAVQLGNNAVGGVDFTHYWPLRLPGRNFKPLLTDTGEMTAVAMLFAKSGEMLSRSEVSQSLTTDGLYVLRSRRDCLESLMIVNNTDKFKTLELEVANQKKASIVIQRFTGQEDGNVLRRSESALRPVGGEVFSIVAPEKGITFVRVEINDVE